jgi:hypothetical protein
VPPARPEVVLHCSLTSQCVAHGHVGVSGAAEVDGGASCQAGCCQRDGAACSSSHVSQAGVAHAQLGRDGLQQRSNEAEVRAARWAQGQAARSENMN